MEYPDEQRPSLAFRFLGNVKGIQSAWKDMGRAREIGVVLARHGFGAMVGLLGVGDKAARTVSADETIREVSTPDRAVRIRRVIEELGPTFIKLGQILSTRPDVIPPDIIEELQHLQDRVPPMSWEDAQGVLRDELGDDYERHFKTVDPQPLASASIAQVHRAILDDGREVAIKVQRPDIVPQIRSDLHIIYFFARRLLQLIPELELMDPLGIVSEFDKALSLELDFDQEAEHIRRFRHNFRSFNGIVIPKVYESCSGRRVITMDYIRGYKATEAHHHVDIDPNTVAPRMLRALFKMIFEDGYFHGDLHPGNVLVQPDGTIGLIDFGLVGKLSERQRDNILDILIGVSRRDYALVARVFYELGIKVPCQHYDYQRFEDDVVALMETHLGDKNISEMDMGAFFTDIVHGAIRHRIQMPPTYTMVFKALVTVEGMGKTLAPDINFMEHATPFVRDMLVERYSPRRILRESIDLVSSTSRFMRGVPAMSVQVLEDLARGSLTIRTRSSDISALVRAQRKHTNHLIRALVAVGFSLVGTLAWSLPTPTLLGMSVPTIVFYLLAMGFGLPLLWRSWRGSL